EPEHGDDLLQLVRLHRQLEEENDGIDEDQEISRDGLISSRKRVADRNHRSVRTVAVTPGVSAALPRGSDARSQHSVLFRPPRTGGEVGIGLARMVQPHRLCSRLSQSVYCFLTLAIRCSCLALISCLALAALVFNPSTLRSASRWIASRLAFDLSNFSCSFAFSVSIRDWSLALRSPLASACSAFVWAMSAFSDAMVRSSCVSTTSARLRR